MARKRKISTSKKKSQKKRVVRSVARIIVDRLFMIVKRILRPFRFIIKPFKLKPFKIIGRFLAKVLLINYFVSSWKELKQVTWPNGKQTFQLSFAVFVFSIIFGIMIALVDYGLDKLFKQILLR